MQQSNPISQLTSQIDTAALQARFETLRKSEYFPALLGAAAGGLMAAVIALAISGRRTEVKYVASEDGSRSGETRVLGFKPSELMQLVTVVVSLARQLREWRDQSQY